MLLGFRGAEGDPRGEKAGAGGTERSDGVGGLSLELMQIKNPATTFCDACSCAIAYEKARLMVMAPSRERVIVWETGESVRVQNPSEPYDERESNP